MASTSCRVDPEVIAEMNARRARDGWVVVGIVLKPEFRLGPPHTMANYENFKHLVHGVLGRVADKVDEGSWWPAKVDALFIHASRGAFMLTARVAFVEELLKQPEVAECVADLAFYEPPAPDEKGLD